MAVSKERNIRFCILAAMSTIDKEEESSNKRRTCCSLERIEECRFTANSIMNTKINPQHATNSYNGGEHNLISLDLYTFFFELLSSCQEKRAHITSVSSKLKNRLLGVLMASAIKPKQFLFSVCKDVLSYYFI